MILLSRSAKSFDGGATFAVRNVSLEVGDGETLVLLGASGCGKTTTLKMINRLIEPSRGRIEVDGVSVLDRNVLELRRSIGYVFQDIGLFPHLTALVPNALLPIVLNTFTGLREVPRQVIEAADGQGFSPRQRLWMVEFPLAAPVIIAGIRAAVVLTVGIATLSTYIGAGGLGDFIARGLARNDSRLTLLGAVPAALMAVALSLLIRVVERLVPRG